MSFATYLAESWDQHQSQSAKIADGFSAGAARAQTNSELGRLAPLIAHVCGEHLGDWKRGISALRELRQHPAFEEGSETDRTIERLTASLRLASGWAVPLDGFALSEKIRVYGVAATALATRDTPRAVELFQHALALESAITGKDDPANRVLAVTGNNLAVTLEELPSRTAAENELMLLAARTGRKYWERAGTWLEVSRAEYRLALSHLHAGLATAARAHAEICYNLCRENQAGAFDLFFAHEARARGAAAAGDRDFCTSEVAAAEKEFLRIEGGDRDWCARALDALRSL